MTAEEEDVAGARAATILRVKRGEAFDFPLSLDVKKPNRHDEHLDHSSQRPVCYVHSLTVMC